MGPPLKTGEILHQLKRHTPFMTMAFGDQLTPIIVVCAAGFLFLAVWVPCCTSDIIFPLLFAERISTDEQVVLASSLRSDGSGAIATKAKGSPQ